MPSNALKTVASSVTDAIPTPYFESGDHMTRQNSNTARDASRGLRLTAVITNYNHGHYLAAAVEAMVNQSRPADEFILIDDASTDGSRRVVDGLSKRYPFITIIRHATNRGAHASGCEAVEMASGDFFYWGSADDMVLPGFFESSMSLLERFPTAQICAGIPIHWNESFDQQYAMCPRMPRDPGFLGPQEVSPLVRQRLLEMSGASVMYRLENLKELGGFRKSLKWHVDFFLAHALALGRGLAWTAQPASVFRMHGSNYSGIRFERPEEEQQALAELARVLIDEMPTEIQKGFRSSGVLGRFEFPMARLLLSNHKYSSQLSAPFWRVCFATMKRKVISIVVKTLVPQRFRLSMPRMDRTKTQFDLSRMKPDRSI